MSRHLSCLAAVGFLFVAPVVAAAQTPSADEHAAHHPAAQAAAGSAVAGPAASAPPATPSHGAPTGQAPAAMGGMMGDCAGEGCGSRASIPLMAQVLALRPEDDAARQTIAAESHRRMEQGAAMTAQGAKDAQWAASMRDAATLDRARAQLREGHALFESGAAAHLALARGPGAPAGALDWFRQEMSLPSSNAHGSSLWLGATPAHLLLMTTLVLLAASLLGVQLLRRGRARAILDASPAGPKALPAPARQTAIVAKPAAAAAAAFTPAAPAELGAPAAPVARAKKWSGVLRVAQVFAETSSVSTFRLVDPGGGVLPFGYAPGQFLQVEVEPTPGSPVKRSYTIASSPTQNAYVELTVKREDQGVISAYLHANVKQDDLLKVAGPFGAFTFTGSDADSIVLIAGGVGITPMMSVLRYLTDLVWPGDIFFIYTARSPGDVVFREEIEYLERRHPNLHVLVMVDTRPPGTSWLGPEGRLTRELLQNEVPEIGRRRIHLCGPPPMMAALQAILRELGVPNEQVKTEAFGPASLPTQPPPPEDAASAPVASAEAERKKETPPQVAPATVTFSVAGVAAALPQDTSVLEAAESAGVEIPYSCRVGVCGVCVVKLTKGEVTMAVEEGLDPTDKAQGYVLACQAKSTGGDLVVEA